MGSLVFTLDADEGRAVQALLNIVRAEKEAAKGLKDINAAAGEAGEGVSGLGRHAQKVSPHFQSMEKSALGFGASLVSAATGAVSIGTAVNAIRQTVEADLEALRQKAVQLRGALDDLAKGGAAAGTPLKLLPDIQKMVDETPGGKFDPAQKAAIFKAGAEAAGPGASMELLTQTFKTAIEHGQVAGRDPMAMAETMGRMGKLYGADMTPEALRDLATQRLETTGGKAFTEEDMRLSKHLQARGLTGETLRETTLSLSRAKLEGGESAKVAERIAKEITEQESWESEKREVDDPAAQKKLATVRAKQEQLKKKREAEEDRRREEDKQRELQREALQDLPDTARGGRMVPGKGWVADAGGRGAGAERQEKLKAFQREEIHLREAREDADAAERKEQEALSAQASELAKKKTTVLTPEGQRRRETSTWTAEEKARRVLAGDTGWLPKDVQSDPAFGSVTKEMQEGGGLYSSTAAAGAQNALAIQQQQAETASPMLRDLKAAQLEETGTKEQRRLSPQLAAAYEKQRQLHKRQIAEAPGVLGMTARAVMHIPGAETYLNLQSEEEAGGEIARRNAEDAERRRAMSGYGQHEAAGVESVEPRRMIISGDERSHPNPVARTPGGASYEDPRRP